ncbi:MAG: bi-domain-containing oxidoreductase [Proteobacteria bacterium]|nr:bi-domain-containing oxidoreductase [Pseudomonadota bacterium]
MKQVIQSRRSGKLALKDVPAPKVRSGHLLVRTRASLISAGTERMVVEFAQKSLLGKAQSRPDLVRKVVDKAKREGITQAFKAAMARLDEPLPLGYSAAGEIVAVGRGLEGRFRVGGRVAIAGAGIANHAELNVVPENLAASIPDGVADEAACYGTLGAIALHAVRNAQAGLGDVVAVIGCGLVGQLASMFLTLQGARAVVIDPDAVRRQLALELGAELALSPDDSEAGRRIQALNGGLGADAVIIAAATPSSAPFALTAEIARDRARVVMVGLTGTEFPYQGFMQKELNLIVSRSYGPGRYDSDYEGRGVKYPPGWVRWTETENLAEALRLMAPERKRRLDVGRLTTHRFPLADAAAAYDLVTGGGESHLGVVITYGAEPVATVSAKVFRRDKTAAGNCVVGAIGGGNFARAVLFPALKALPGVRLHTLATQRGATAEHGAETFGFEIASADHDAVLSDPAINAVVIATRHDSHAALTAAALRAGKSVFVEKPLALDFEQLNDVIAARNASGGFLQVGFNRRFAPKIAALKAHLGARPMVLSIRVNAGAIEAGHWTQSGDEGGGRVLGEICHFVDLARHIAGAPIAYVRADAAVSGAGNGDDIAAQIGFRDGSLSNIVYTAQGDTALSKERIEAFAGGRAAVLDDFRTLTLFAGGNAKTSISTQDKGHKAQIAAFVEAVRGNGPVPIDEAELIETSAATIALLQSLCTGERIDL